MIPVCLLIICIPSSSISLPVGHPEDDPCISGPGWHMEHGPAAPCWPRAVLLHPGSEWWDGLHACGRARRSVALVYNPVFSIQYPVFQGFSIQGSIRISSETEGVVSFLCVFFYLQTQDLVPFMYQMTGALFTPSHWSATFTPPRGVRQTSPTSPPCVEFSSPASWQKVSILAPVFG